jgi:hypothetical protein
MCITLFPNTNYISHQSFIWLCCKYDAVDAGDNLLNCLRTAVRVQCNLVQWKLC